MKLIHRSAFISLFLSIVLTGCGGGGSDEQPSSNQQPDTSQQTVNNALPVAVISGNTTGFVDQEVILSGAGSSDANGDVLTYAWQFIDKPNNSGVDFESASSEHVTFAPDQVGTYTIELTVNDGTESSVPVEYSVVITEALFAPTAVISTSSDNKQGQTIELDGSLSTFDNRSGTELGYNWRFISKPENSVAEILGSDTATTTFIPDLGGAYLVELQVTDGVGEVSIATFEINVTANQSPVVQVVVDLDYVLGTEAYAYSRVEDDDSVHSYNWSFSSVPSGSTLANADFDEPYLAFMPDVAGDYQVILEVSDGFHSVVAENVTLTVVERSSIAMKIGVLSNYFGKVNEPILIDFATSVSPTGSQLSYSKSVLSGPSGSRPSLTNSLIDKAETKFSANLPGDYRVKFTATNEEGDSVSSTVQIKLFDENENFNPNIITNLPRYIKLGEALNIDASASIDPEGDLINYRWQVISKPTFSGAEIRDPEAAKTSVEAITTPGIYVFRITPSDNFSSITSYGNFLVWVYHQNVAVGLNSMKEQFLATGTTVSLPGVINGEMDEGDELIWDLLAAPYNSSSTLADRNELNPEFLFDVAGKFVFQLRLLRQGEVHAVKHLVVRVLNNDKPTADAGEDLTAISGESVMLDGSGSSDSEDNLVYEWSVVGARETLGSVPTFDDNTAIQPQLFLNNSYTGQLVVRLSVSDGVNEPVHDEMIIDITTAPAAARLNKIDLATIEAIEVELPYENTEVVEPLSTPAGENGIRLLGMFHLHADNANITVRNIQVVDLNNNVTPVLSVFELNPTLGNGELTELSTSSDLIINADDFVQIMVSSPAITNDKTALVELSFMIVETGETVSAKFEYTN